MGFGGVLLSPGVAGRFPVVFGFLWGWYNIPCGYGGIFGVSALDTVVYIVAWMIWAFAVRVGCAGWFGVLFGCICCVFWICTSGLACEGGWCVGIFCGLGVGRG